MSCQRKLAVTGGGGVEGFPQPAFVWKRRGLDLYRIDHLFDDTRIWPCEDVIRDHTNIVHFSKMFAKSQNQRSFPTSNWSTYSNCVRPLQKERLYLETWFSSCGSYQQEIVGYQCDVVTDDTS